MIVLIYVIIAIYTLLIGSLALGVGFIKPFNKIDKTPEIRFSIIVPFRNETENLPSLIESFEALNYPSSLFEIILVDDDSDDNSVELSLRLLSSTQLDFSIIKNNRQSNSPKKDAISTAIEKAKYHWIITTDADCKVPKQWLSTLDAFINRKDVNMIAAPVTYINSESIFHQFQTLDILSLQGATIGAFGLKTPFMCNGANLAYTKTLFKEINGFDDNNSIASGDDVFSLQKAIKHTKGQVKYLKSYHAVVLTQPEASFSDLFQQRIRWAAKSSSYKSFTGKLIGLIVFVTNALIVAMLLLSILDLINWLHFIAALTIKISIDYLLLHKSATFFKQTDTLKTYFFSSLIYPFLSTYIAMYSMFFKYKWKGRTFKK